MKQNKISVIDADELVSAGKQAARSAKRATLQFRAFVLLQAALALGFTLTIDVAGVGYWKAFVPFLLGTLCLWVIALLRRQSAPRYGLRNMGIAVATWFVLYTFMLDPALQLLQLSSPWWWVLAGVVAVSPILACLFASSRR